MFASHVSGIRIPALRSDPLSVPSFPSSNHRNPSSHVHISRSTQLRPPLSPLSLCSLSPDLELEPIRDDPCVETQIGAKRTQFLCASHGWRALLVDHDDLDMLRRFSHVQAEVFYTPASFLNDFLFSIFKAEVLSSLLYKIRNSGHNRFACLVAVPDSPAGPDVNVVGVVDAAAMADEHVLKCLPGTREYLYISGMAVDAAYRRQKVATVLLQACNLIASDWGFEFLVLQAYEDDKAARMLYANNGFETISIDPWWLSKWFGKRRRVILAKRAS